MTSPRPQPASPRGRVLQSLAAVAAVTLVIFFGGSAFRAVQKIADREEARDTLRPLARAIEAYYKTRNQYPVLSPYADHTGTADAELLHALDGSNPVLNPDGTVFYTPDAARLSPDGSLLDPWGTPYHVVMDTTFNQRVPNPQPDPNRPQLPAHALVYSAGPDRDPTTWDDNFTSW